MREIFTIAMREITRLYKRLGGGASPIAIALLLGALAFSGYALRNAASLGSGLYRVGVAGDVPEIQDNRFAVVKVNPDQAQAMLADHEIDVFINGAEVTSRGDDHSLFAVNALKHTLEKLELQRVENAYAANLSFPLRVGINYLDPGSASAGAGSAAAPAKAEEVVIPSLTPPPAPFAQVVLTLLYVLPVTFISIFFTSSFMDEKVNRRLTILLSAPITPIQIILGKMLPYAIFATAATILIALITKANVLLAVAIFTPTTLFIFAIYLMVPLFYRTFKDTTFISMLVTTLTTAYLVFPAMFTGISDMAYMSPLTLAVKMYRNEPFGWREYLFPSLPMAAIFGLALFSATRLLNEEFLMGYRSIARKIADAVFLVMDRTRPYVSVVLVSLLSIPLVYLGQLVILAFATNLPVGLMLGATLMMAALMEEVVKSIGIVVLVEHGVVSSTKSVLMLAFLSALGFLVGEKLLLFLSIRSVSEARLSGALFSAGGFLLIPLAAHFLFTASVTLLKTRGKFNYTWALAAGTILHTIYNWYLSGGLR